jgi:hypothetical protein
MTMVTRLLLESVARIEDALFYIDIHKGHCEKFASKIGSWVRTGLIYKLLAGGVQLDLSPFLPSEFI